MRTSQFSLILVCIIICITAVFAFFYSNKSKTDRAPLVAITQIVPHPSLDAIREGIVEGLNANGIDSSQIIFDNAMGNMATAVQIADKFKGLKPKVIVPITTPSAQAVASRLRRSQIPIVFVAVSDPVAAKLIPSMTQTGDNITGLSDLSPVEKQLDLALEILPQLKQLGVVYSSGESNSAALVALLEKACLAKGVTLVRATAASTNDIAQATQTLVGKVDAIYVPNDNTVVSALPALLGVANKAKIPVLSADPDSVERGALASISHNQRALGLQAAKMILRILAGEQLENIKPELGVMVKLVVNLKAAKQLDITFPNSVLGRADLRIGEQR
jgi:putative ABC transport system substrate-binding protein